MTDINIYRHDEEITFRATEFLIQLSIALNVPVFIVGPYGTGKTTYVSWLAKQLQMTDPKTKQPLIISLANRSIEHVMALPAFDTNSCTVGMAPQIMWKDAFEHPTLIILDDWTEADSTLQANIAEIIDRKPIGVMPDTGKKLYLHKLSRIVLVGNNVSNAAFENNSQLQPIKKMISRFFTVAFEKLPSYYTSYRLSSLDEINSDTINEDVINNFPYKIYWELFKPILKETNHIKAKDVEDSLVLSNKNPRIKNAEVIANVLGDLLKREQEKQISLKETKSRRSKPEQYLDYDFEINLRLISAIFIPLAIGIVLNQDLLPHQIKEEVIERAWNLLFDGTVGGGYDELRQLPIYYMQGLPVNDVINNLELIKDIPKQVKDKIQPFSLASVLLETIKVITCQPLINVIQPLLKDNLTHKLDLNKLPSVDYNTIMENSKLLYNLSNQIVKLLQDNNDDYLNKTIGSLVTQISFRYNQIIPDVKTIFNCFLDYLEIPISPLRNQIITKLQDPIGVKTHKTKTQNNQLFNINNDADPLLHSKSLGLINNDLQKL